MTKYIISAFYDTDFKTKQDALEFLIRSYNLTNIKLFNKVWADCELVSNNKH